MAKSPKKIGKLAFRRNLLDGLRDVIILVNARSEIVDFNLSAHAFLASNVKKRVTIRDALPIAVVGDTVERVLKGESVEPQDVHLPYLGGKIFEMAAISLPSSEVKKPSWVMLAFHDVTKARNAEKARAEFIANLSHELRSPLTTVIGLIDTLRGPAKDDVKAQQRFLDIMQAEAARMGRLVEDLLSLSRLAEMERGAPRSTVSLTQMLSEVAGGLSIRAKEKGMGIEIDAASKGDPLLVTGDHDELVQVFDNLIGNAIKYGRKKTPITIIMRKSPAAFDGDEFDASVSVVNFGPGVPAEHIGRLTERFYRIEKGRSRAAGGAGLGLTIVDQIVKRHRGRLAISSVEGEQTSFTVYLRNFAPEGGEARHERNQSAEAPDPRR